MTSPNSRVARQGDGYAVKVCRHTGMIFLGQTRTTVVRGSLDDCRAALRSAQTHNLIFGWWGIISLLIYNWIAIISNFRARKGLEVLASQPVQTPAG